MRDSVVFYRSFYEAIKEIPLEEQAIVYNAIYSYALDGVELELNGVAKAVFLLVKPQIDANNTRYENSCKGGAPKGNQNAKKQPKNNQETTEKQPKVDLEEQKKQPNENDNENENDNVLKTPEEYLKVFPEKLQDKLREWLNYKKQRKEKYTDIGLRNFFAQVWNRRKENGDDAIIELIGVCMANNWKGIIWDKLADGKKRSNVNNAYQGEQPEYENLDNFYMT